MFLQNAHYSDASAANRLFATLGQSTFYRGQVTAGDNQTALLFTSDEQLSLLRPSHLMYINSTFRIVPSLYCQLFTVFVSSTRRTPKVCTQVHTFGVLRVDDAKDDGAVQSRHGTTSPTCPRIQISTFIITTMIIIMFGTSQLSVHWQTLMLPQLPEKLVQ